MSVNFMIEESVASVLTSPYRGQTGGSPVGRRSWVWAASWLVFLLFMWLLISSSVCSAHDLYTKTYLTPGTHPSCMQVMWQTDTDLHGGWVKWGYSADNLVHYSQASQEHQIIKCPGFGECDGASWADDFTRWDATICAKQGERVFYKAYGAEEPLTPDADAAFTIAGDFVLPLPSSARHLTFFGYGDTRVHDDTDDLHNYHLVSEAIYNEFDTGGNNPQTAADHQTFLLHSGDGAFDGGRTFASYWDNFWIKSFFGNNGWEDGYHSQTLRSLLARIPLAMANGNHDFAWDGHADRADMKYFYIEFPRNEYALTNGGFPYLDDDGKLQNRRNDPTSLGDAYYSFDYGPVHVAVVDAYAASSQSLCHLTGELKETGRQYAWLKSDLETTAKPWKVVMLHVPPYSCDYCAANASASSGWPDFLALLEDMGVDILVAGHDHYYHRPDIKTSNVCFLVLGGGARRSSMAAAVIIITTPDSTSQEIMS